MFFFFLFFFFPRALFMAALSTYAEVTQLCDTHGIALDELGFVHELPAPVVLEGSKLALPYAILVSLVSEAERRLAAARVAESPSLALSDAAVSPRQHSKENAPVL